MFLPPVDQEWHLPSDNAWSNFKCCTQPGNKACLLSVCPNAAIHRSTRPVAKEELLAWVHPDAEHLERLLTDDELLSGVFDCEEPIPQIRLPLLYQVQTVIDAAFFAFERNTIVLAPGGAQHHAAPRKAEGAGVFCDVPLAWLLLRQRPGNLKALYIDTDVHHANGFAQARVELGMEDHFFMLDMFNDEIWPFTDVERTHDTVANVNIPVRFGKGIGGKNYVALLEAALERATAELPVVNMVFYMCCNDALEDDPLGRTKVSASFIYERDAMVVRWARQQNPPVPIVIMPGRGYGPSSCRVARESMARLNDEFGIW